MLHCGRIDLSEGIDSTKSNNTNRYMVFCYRSFNHGFEFQDSVCNYCHALTMLCLDISDISVITIKGVDYRCIINGIRKSEAIRLLENYLLEDRWYI